MEHLRDRLAHELEEVAVGDVPGDVMVVAQGVQLEVPGRGEDDGDQVTGRHPHQYRVSGRPHTGPDEIFSDTSDIGPMSNILFHFITTV